MNEPSTHDQLEQLIGAVRELKPSPLTPLKAYSFKKTVITTATAQSFNFDFIPDRFAVYIQYATGALAALFREGQFSSLISTDSDAIPLLDGLFLKIPARDQTCTIHNLSGSSITVLVFALGPGADVEISQAK